MRPRHAGEDNAQIDRATATLPESYLRWRASRLGRIADSLERDLILELCGEVAGHRVLDVGCGDGDLAMTLRRAGAVVTGLDADPRMLRAAAQRRGSEALPIGLVRGDVNVLPFADETFDLVTAITVLCFVPDAHTAMAEMTRVLRPGGRLVLGELGRCSAWAALRRVRGWLGSATWRAARFRSARDLRRLVEHAGLSVAMIRGSVFFPPVGWMATAMAGADPWIGRRTTCAAAFIAVAAAKSPASGLQSSAEK